MRNVPAALHGTQPGDPVKLVKVVTELAAAAPLHLPVVLDSLQTYRINRDKIGKEIEALAEKFTPTEMIIN